MKKLVSIVLCLALVTVVYAMGEKIQDVSVPAASTVENATAVVPVVSSNVSNVDVVVRSANAAVVMTGNAAALLPTADINEKLQDAVKAVSENQSMQY